MWHKLSTQAAAQRATQSVQRNAPLITKQHWILVRHLSLIWDSNPWSWLKTAHVTCVATGNCGIAGLKLWYGREFWRGSGWRNRYSSLLRAGRSWNRIPMWSRFFVPVLIGCRTHPASCAMGTGCLARGEGAGPWCYTHSLPLGLRDLI